MPPTRRRRKPLSTYELSLFILPLVLLLAPPSWEPCGEGGVPVGGGEGGVPVGGGEVSLIHHRLHTVFRRHGPLITAAAQLSRVPCEGTTYPFLVASYAVGSPPPNCLASYPSNVVVFSAQTDFSLIRGNPATTGWSYLWSPQIVPSDTHAFPSTANSHWSISASYLYPLVSQSCTAAGYIQLHCGCHYPPYDRENVHLRLSLPPDTAGGLYYQYAIDGSCNGGDSGFTLTSNAATSTPIISFASTNTQTGVSETPFTNFNVPAGTYVDARVSIANNNCNSAGSGVAATALFFPQGQPNLACAVGSPHCEADGEVPVYDVLRDFTVAVPRADWRLPWRYGWSSFHDELGFTSLPRTFVSSSSNPPESNADYMWGFRDAIESYPYIALVASTFHSVAPGTHLVLHPGCVPADYLRAKVRWLCPSSDPGAVHIAGDWINGESCGDARPAIHVGATSYFNMSSTLSNPTFTFAARIGGASTAAAGAHVTFTVAVLQVCTCAVTGLAARVRWFSLPRRNASCAFQARRCGWEKQSIAIYRLEDDVLSQTNPTDANWTFGDSTLPTPTGALDTGVGPMTESPWQSGESVGYRSVATGTSVARFIGVPVSLVPERRDNRVVTLTSCSTGAAGFRRAVARWTAPRGGIQVRVVGRFLSPLTPVVRGAIAVPCENFLWVAPAADSNFNFTFWLCDRPSAAPHVALIDFTMLVDVGAAALLPCAAINVSVTATITVVAATRTASQDTSMSASGHTASPSRTADSVSASRSNYLSTSGSHESTSNTITLSVRPRIARTPTASESSSPSKSDHSTSFTPLTLSPTRLPLPSSTASDAASLSRPSHSVTHTYADLSPSRSESLPLFATVSPSLPAVVSAPTAVAEAVAAVSSTTSATASATAVVSSGSFLLAQKALSVIGALRCLDSDGPQPPSMVLHPLQGLFPASMFYPEECGSLSVVTSVASVVNGTAAVASYRCLSDEYVIGAATNLCLLLPLTGLVCACGYCVTLSLFMRFAPDASREERRFLKDSGVPWIRRIRFFTCLPGCFGVPLALCLVRSSELAVSGLSISVSPATVAMMSSVMAVVVASVGWIAWATYTAASGCGCQSTPGRSRHAFPAMVVDLRETQAHSLAATVAASSGRTSIHRGLALSLYFFVAGGRTWSARSVAVQVDKAHQEATCRNEAEDPLLQRGRRPNEQRPESKAPPPPPIRPFIDPFHRCWGSLYLDYRVERRWYLAVDLSLTMLSTVAGSVKSTAPEVCAAAKIMVLAASLAALGGILVLRPYLVPLDKWHAVTVGAVTVAAAILCFPASTTDAAGVLGAIASVLSVAKLAFDVAILIMEMTPIVRSTHREALDAARLSETTRDDVEELVERPPPVTSDVDNHHPVVAGQALLVSATSAITAVPAFNGDAHNDNDVGDDEVDELLGTISHGRRASHPEDPRPPPPPHSRRLGQLLDDLLLDTGDDATFASRLSNPLRHGNQKAAATGHVTPQRERGLSFFGFDL